jgi:3-phenylpropionate/cinnamic acid dioxygenase small subunit
MIAAAPGLTAGLDLRARLADLYCAYDNVLNDGELERWPELFTETCIYRVIPRQNFEQGLPVSVIYCENRDMLADRVVALRETALFAPRIARRMTTGICLRAIDSDGLPLTASFAVFQTTLDQPSELFLCGNCRDRVVEDADGTLRFAERIFVYDSTIVPTSLVYPL